MADLEVKLRLNESALKSFARTNDMKEAMTQIGHYVETQAKMHAPVRTGNLRRSITSYVEQERLGWTAYVGTNVQYGVFQELGTVRHPPHPFLRPALEDLRKALRFRQFD